MRKHAFIFALALSGLLGVFVSLSPALSPTATTGFVMLSHGSGTPTGVPSSLNNDVAPCYFDDVAKNLFVYSSGWFEQGGDLLFAKTSATVAVTNTTTETTVCSFSVPANYLSTNNRVRLTIRGALSTKASAPGTFTVKVKYGSGSTTIVSAVTLGTSGSSAGVLIDADVAAANAAGSQLVYGRYSDGVTAPAATLIGRGAQTVDSTAIQTLVATWAFGTADPANVFTLEHATAEVVR